MQLEWSVIFSSIRRSYNYLVATNIQETCESFNKCIFTTCYGRHIQSVFVTLRIVCSYLFIIACCLFVCPLVCDSSSSCFYVSLSIYTHIHTHAHTYSYTQGDKGYAGVQGTPGSQGHAGPKGHAGPIGPKVNESCCQRAVLTQTVYRLYSWSNSFTCACVSSYGITTGNYRFLSLTGQHRAQWTWRAKRWPGNIAVLPTLWLYLFLMLNLCLNA